MIYYGSEALFNGGSDPLNREVFDISRHTINKQIADHLRSLNAARKRNSIWNLEPEYRHASKDILVFTKGPDLLVVVTNTDNPY